MRAVSHTLRRLAHTPSFAIATISLIAFGVGAATAIFSVVDAVLLEPLSPDAARRVVMYRTERDSHAVCRPQWGIRSLGMMSLQRRHVILLGYSSSVPELLFRWCLDIGGVAVPDTPNAAPSDAVIA